MERWLVRVDFNDHADCEGEPAVIPCTIWGVLVEETENAYHVLKWEASHENSEYWAIVKQAVTSFERIRIEK